MDLHELLAFLEQNVPIPPTEMNDIEPFTEGAFLSELQATEPIPQIDLLDRTEDRPLLESPHDLLKLLDIRPVRDI